MKKRLLLMLIALCALPFLIGAGTSTSAEAGLSVSAIVDGVEISAVEANGEKYLFMPSDADITKLSLRFKLNGVEAASVTLSGENGSIKAAEVIDLRNVAGSDRQGCYVFSAEAAGTYERINIMLGEGISSIYLRSGDAEKNREWVDLSKSNVAKGSMLMVTEKGEIIYDGALGQIKARGNSTFREYPKKAYQIKLETKTDLLGTGEKVKTWVLLANYGDATMQHDKLMKDLASSLGMPYTASCGWVNLYYDGEYRGVYLLSEKVSVGSAGVDITDMEEVYEKLNSDYGDDVEVAEGTNVYGQKYLYTPGLTEPEEITGGYLIERNLDFIDEVNGFYTSQGAAFNLKSPEWTGNAAMDYISSYYQEFEDAVFATDENGNYTGINPVTNKSFDEYVDLSSLVQVFLLQELALNPDGFESSFFFYKDAGGIMYAGPIWDQDIVLGTGWTKYIPHTVVDYHYLEAGLIRIPAFRKAVEEYFTLTFMPVVEKWLGQAGTIEKNSALLASDAAMNYKLWPYVRIGDPANEGHLWARGTDYAKVTQDMESWVVKRLDVMKSLYYNEDCVLRYRDVSEKNWMYGAVCFVTGRGLMQGVGSEMFAPGKAMDQGTLFTVLARLEGTDTTPAAGAAWYTPGMNWAHEQGFLVSEEPNAYLPRERLAWVLWKLKGMPDTDGAITGFSDIEKISGECRTAMSWAVENGILQGDVICSP